MVQVFIIFFILPEWGLQLEAFPAALLAMAIMGSAFICEIVAGGISSIPRGQWEAAISSGLTLTQQLRLVILPQAMKVILPPLVGQYVLLIKGHICGVGHRRHGPHPGGLGHGDPDSRRADGLFPGGAFFILSSLTPDSSVQLPGTENGGISIRTGKWKISLNLKM